MKPNSSRRKFLKAGLALPAVGLLSANKLQKNNFEEVHNPMTKEAGNQVLVIVDIRRDSTCDMTRLYIDMY